MPDPEPDSSGDILDRALGQELQLRREVHGWSRGEMATRLPFDISRRTVNSYELGDSRFSVHRFVAMCRLLRSHAPDVLASALQRAEVDATHCPTCGHRPAEVSP